MLFWGVHEKGNWWFKVLGWGLYGRNFEMFPLLFSERYNFKPNLKIGHWIFGVLFPIKI